MAKALEHWKVLPHGPLEPLTDSILTVAGEFNMPLTRFERRMTIVRLADRRLVIYSAMALEEAQMRAIEEFGTPAFLVVPNRYHRNDAAIYKKRYPRLTVVAPSGARKAVEEVVAVDTAEPAFGDPKVRFVEIAGTRGGDSALECEEASGLTLITNDIIGHMPASSGWFLRATGFAGAIPRIPRVIRLALIKDKRAFRAQLDAWAQQPVTHIIVSHGTTISREPRGVLRELAVTV